MKMLKFITRGNFIDFKYVEDVIHHRYSEHTIITLHNTSKCIDWKLPEDTTLISFTIDELQYENIPISGIQFDGVTMTTQADFETGIVAMFPGLTSGGGGSSYLSYVALLNQDNQINHPPTDNILENTTGSVPVWSYFGLGKYILTGDFPLGKVVAFAQVTNGGAYAIDIDLTSDGQVYIATQLFDGNYVNGQLSNTPIMIFVYP